MSELREFRNPERPGRIDLRAYTEQGVIEVKQPGCAPTRYRIGPPERVGEVFSIRPVDEVEGKAG